MPDAVPDITRLSPEQAVKAVGLFYDLAPATCWEGGQKPPPARILTVADGVRDAASDDSQRFVDALFDAGNTEAKGEVARLLLTRLGADESVRPYVVEAIALAVRPTRAIDPLSLTAILGVLFLASQATFKERKKSGDSTEATGLAAVIASLHVDKLAKALPAIIKATPLSVLTKLVG